MPSLFQQKSALRKSEKKNAAMLCACKYFSFIFFKHKIIKRLSKRAQVNARNKTANDCNNDDDDENEMITK